GAGRARPSHGAPGDERLLRPPGSRRDRAAPPRGPLGDLAARAPPGPRVRALGGSRADDPARQGLRLPRVRLAALALLALLRGDAEPGARRAACGLPPGLAAARARDLRADRPQHPPPATPPARARADDAADPRLPLRLVGRRGRRLRLGRRPQPAQGPV